jgi:hypothetical protein
MWLSPGAKMLDFFTYASPSLDLSVSGLNRLARCSARAYYLTGSWCCSRLRQRQAWP